jgi:hypothetical protein
MKSLLTGDDLFAEILILRNVSNRTFVVLEGESDCNSLDPHIEEADCETIAGYSKSVVLRAIELVDDQYIQGVVALVDRDWIGFCDQRPESPNLFTTDFYDLDATIFFSGRIAQKFFSAHGDRDERKAYLIACGKSDISEAIARLALPVGYLRLLSCRNRYGLKLRDFPVAAAMKPDCMTLDVEAVVNIAYKRSGGLPSVSKHELVNELVKDISIIDDAKKYCSGHDLTRALAAIVSRRLHLTMSSDAAARGMRAVFSVMELKTTQFYVDLKEWAEARNRIIWKVEYSE